MVGAISLRLSGKAFALGAKTWLALAHQTFCDVSGQARPSRGDGHGRARFLAHQTYCDVSGRARPSLGLARVAFARVCPLATLA
jgi:hypothetical protein